MAALSKTLTEYQTLLEEQDQPGKDRVHQSWAHRDTNIMVLVMKDDGTLVVWKVAN